MNNKIVVLSNLESINALLIQQGVPQEERIIKLNEIAISQMRSSPGIKQIESLNND